MPSHTLEAAAINVLQQRGVQPTPANVQAIKNALEQNPELLDNVQGSFRQQQRPGEADRTESTNPIVFRDQFDTALETAVSGDEGQISSTGGATFPAQAITPVVSEAIGQIAASLPPEEQNKIVDAITGGSGEVSGGLSSSGSGSEQSQAEGEGDGFPFFVAPGAKGAQQGAEVAVREGAGLPTVNPRGGGRTGPGQIAAGAAPLQLEGPQRALAAPDNPARERPSPRRTVTEEVGAGVDAADAKGAKIKQTTFEGRPAATFRVGKDQIVTPDGERFAVKSQTGTDLVDVREPGLLERIRTFLQANAQELRAVLRAVR